MQTLETRLDAVVPDGWFYKESITLLAADGQANVIFSSEPLDSSIDLQRYTDAQGELLKKEFPEYREITFEATRMLGGRDGYLRRFEWTPPDGVRVVQIQLYYVERERGFTATATTPAANFHNVESDLTVALERLGLQPSAAAAAAS